jgi:cell division septation protein DedD
LLRAKLLDLAIKSLYGLRLSDFGLRIADFGFVKRNRSDFLFSAYHLLGKVFFAICGPFEMKKNKKVSLSKKPFLVLSRRAIAGWLGAIFILCAWMFIIGVLVGRGTAPVKFDIDGLRTRLEVSGLNQEKGTGGQSRGGSSIVKDKTKLDFYEALPEDRKDTQIDEKKPAQVTRKKVEPLPARKPPQTTGKKAPKKSTSKKEVAEKSGAVKKEAPKQPIASKSTAKPSAKVYTIQVAAVKVAKDADRLVGQLKKKGYSAYRIISKVQGQGIWFRVRVGKYTNRADARATKQKLEKEGMKPIIVQVES